MSFPEYKNTICNGLWKESNPSIKKLKSQVCLRTLPGVCSSLCRGEGHNGIHRLLLGGKVRTVPRVQLHSLDLCPLLLLLYILDHVPLVLIRHSQIAQRLNVADLGVIAPSAGIINGLVHALSIEAAQGSKEVAGHLGIDAVDKGLADETLLGVVGHAALVLVKVESDGHAVHVAELVHLVDHALALGQSEAAHVDEVGNAAGTALRGASLLAETKQGVGANLAAVAVHNHSHRVTRIHQTRGVGADEVSIGGEVGIWRPASIHGEEAWAVDLEPGIAEGRGERAIGGRVVPSAVDEKEGWLGGSRHDDLRGVEAV